MARFHPSQQAEWDHWLKQILALRMRLLFAHFGVDENDWRTLAYQLAVAHVPGFQAISTPPAAKRGRKPGNSLGALITRGAPPGKSGQPKKWDYEALACKFYAWKEVEVARGVSRPTAKSFIESICRAEAARTGKRLTAIRQKQGPRYKNAVSIARKKFPEPMRKSRRVSQPDLVSFFEKYSRPIS